MEVIQSQQSDIFKLTIDCCDEIFEYLSLKDLHSFGSTCKAMQKVAGEYFKQNFSSAPKYSGYDGIYTAYSDDKGVVINRNIQTSGFNRYITYISHYYDNLRRLQYIQTHSDEFESINHIYLVCVIINETRVDFLLDLLPKLETLQIRNSSVAGDLNEMLLKYCDNLKRLFVQESDLGIFRLLDGGWGARIENQWLLNEYPKLEYLEIIPKYTFQIDELNGFFERNPNVKGFSTDSQCLWKNRKQLMKSSASLDLLEVKESLELLDEDDDDENDGEELTMQSLCKLLNQFHERGFYKRLHFFIHKFDEEKSYQLTLVKGLVKVHIKKFTKTYSLPLLTSLKELAIHNGANVNDMNILANSLVHLQRLYLNDVSIDYLMPFIRQSSNLKKIKILPKCDVHFNGGTLKPITLNREREKLADARKVTIYVPDHVFLRTKWAHNNGDTNLNLVEMKRCDSIEWDDHF